MQRRTAGVAVRYLMRAPDCCIACTFGIRMRRRNIQMLSVRADREGMAAVGQMRLARQIRFKLERVASGLRIASQLSQRTKRNSAGHETKLNPVYRA